MNRRNFAATLAVAPLAACTPGTPGNISLEDAINKAQSALVFMQPFELLLGAFVPGAAQWADALTLGMNTAEAALNALKVSMATPDAQSGIKLFTAALKPVVATARDDVLPLIKDQHQKQASVLALSIAEAMIVSLDQFAAGTAPAVMARPSSGPRMRVRRVS